MDPLTEFIDNDGEEVSVTSAESQRRMREQYLAASAPDQPSSSSSCDVTSKSYDIPPEPRRQPTVAVAQSPAGFKDVARFDLGNNRFVVINEFGGLMRIHIREYSATNYPTKKGICLTTSRWAMLQRFMTSLDDSHEPFAHHLGGFVYANSNAEFDTVDIRAHFIPAGTFKLFPTRRGITLRRWEWGQLKKQVEAINAALPEELVGKACSDDTSHSALEGFLQCCECNPSRDGPNNRLEH